MNYTILPDRPVGNYRKTDFLFFISVVLLCGLGFFSLYICSPFKGESVFHDPMYFVKRQAIWFLISFAAMSFFAFVPMKLIRKILPLLIVITIIMCLLPHVAGIGLNTNGASRWIYIPKLGTFQPSEMAKLTVVLFLANLFNKYSSDDDEVQRNFLYPLLGLVFFCTLIFLQRDFSTGIFIFIIGFFMFIACGAKLRWFLPLFLLGIFAVVFFITLEPYRIRRVIAFINPSKFQFSYGYQQMMSQRAIIEGGLWGQGAGSGLGWVGSIPEVHTDYIFAGWSNAMGFVGIAAYFFIIVFFLWRGLAISISCPDRFAAYGSFGCTAMIFIQSILNCCVVAGAAPTTGIPLPFFSSGGSSLFFSLCMCGFIMNASHCPEQNEYENQEVSLPGVRKIESFNSLVVENE